MCIIAFQKLIAIKNLNLNFEFEFVYRDIRLKYNNIFQKQSNNISILEILNPEEISSAKNICMFLKTSLTLRNDILHGHG